MGVVFLNRNSRMGSKAVVGPVTGFTYIIGAAGTPVNEFDAADLLKMTEPPCCGESLPFDGQVRSFGVHIPTEEQLAGVPAEIANWSRPPQVSTVKPKKKRTYKTVKPAVPGETVNAVTVEE